MSKTDTKSSLRANLNFSATEDTNENLIIMMQLLRASGVILNIELAYGKFSSLCN